MQTEYKFITTCSRKCNVRVSNMQTEYSLLPVLENVERGFSNMQTEYSLLPVLENVESFQTCKLNSHYYCSRKCREGFQTCKLNTHYYLF